jgi:putative membrane protein insertion efficiency factor
MPAAETRRLSVAQRGALALIRAYKLLLSQQFAGSCRFLPSCSEYAAEAVGRFGVIHGSALALRRLSRCHPLGSSGYDPVPGPISPLASSSQPPPQI